MKEKRNIIILITIWIIALVTVVGVVIFKNKENQSSVTKEEEKSYATPNKEAKGTSLYATRVDNDIEIIAKPCGPNKQNYYFEISGLKNSETETIINKNIKKIFDKYDKEYGKDEKNTISTILYGNYGDILSYEINITNDENDTLVEEYHTISLKDGKEIDIYDIFINRDIVNSILTKEISRELAKDIDSPNAYADAERTQKEAEIEDITYQCVLGFSQGKGEFAIASDGDVYVRYGDCYAQIEFTTYHDYFAFPTRFMADKSLYKEDINQHDYAFVAVYDENLYYNIGDKDNNTFVDAIIYNYTIDAEVDNYDQFQAKVTSLVDYDKIINTQIASLPNNKYRYINLSGIIYGNEDYTLTSVEYVLKSCTTLSKKYFESTLKPQIYMEKTAFKSSLDSYFNISSIEYDDNGKKNKNVECGYEKSYMTFNKDFKQITSPAEMFVDGYDYQSVIDQVIKEKAESFKIDFETLKNNAKYMISLDAIVIYYSIIDDDSDIDNYDYIYWEDFDEDKLKY